VHGEEKHPYRKRLTPAHFLIDVANEGLSAYGTWKNIRNFGSRQGGPATPAIGMVIKINGLQNGLFVFV
jgi:hypothetical protein